MENKDIVFEMMTLAHMLHRTHDNMIAPQYRAKVTGNNMRLIHYIYRNSDKDIFQRDLEDFFKVRPSTVSANLRLMEKNGLIVRESVEKDGRLKKITLNPEALSMVESTQHIRDEIKEKFTSALTEEERDTLYHLLCKVKLVFDDPITE